MMLFKRFLWKIGFSISAGLVGGPASPLADCSPALGSEIDERSEHELTLVTVMAIY